MWWERYRGAAVRLPKPTLLQERRAALLAKMPHLAQWPGKLARAAKDPSEGHVWEADHRVEVQQTAAAQPSVAAYGVAVG